jgi:hypothetical protein
MDGTASLYLSIPMSTSIKWRFMTQENKNAEFSSPARFSLGRLLHTCLFENKVHLGKKAVGRFTRGEACVFGNSM